MSMWAGGRSHNRGTAYFRVGVAAGVAGALAGVVVGWLVAPPAMPVGVTRPRISRSRLMTSRTVSLSASHHLAFSSAGGSTAGDTTRKPIQNPSLYQCGLLGNCGSVTFWATVTFVRVADRSSSTSWFQLPPRHSRGYWVSGHRQASFQSTGLPLPLAAAFLYQSASYWSTTISATFPCMSCRPHGLGFFCPTSWYPG